MWKEILATAIGVAIGFLLAQMIAKKVPMFNQFESNMDEYEADV